MWSENLQSKEFQFPHYGKTLYYLQVYVINVFMIFFTHLIILQAYATAAVVGDCRTTKMTVIVCNELAILQNFEMVALKTWNRSATMVIKWQYDGFSLQSVYIH